MGIKWGQGGGGQCRTVRRASRPAKGRRCARSQERTRGEAHLGAAGAAQAVEEALGQARKAPVGGGAGVLGAGRAERQAVGDDEAREGEVDGPAQERKEPAVPGPRERRREERRRE